MEAACSIYNVAVAIDIDWADGVVFVDCGQKDEGGERGWRTKWSGLERRWKSILTVCSEKQAVASTVMCTRVETKRKENCTEPWVHSRIYSTGIVHSHSVSVHTV